MGARIEAQQKEALVRQKEDYKQEAIMNRIYLQTQAREKKNRDMNDQGGKAPGVSILPYSNYHFQSQPVVTNQEQAKHMKLEVQNEMWNAYKQQLDEKKQREKLETEFEKRKASELDRAAQKFLALQRTKDLEKKEYVRNLYSENKNSHDYRRTIQEQMKQQNRDEYSKNAKEAEIQEVKRKANYQKFYNELQEKQQKKEEVFHNYMQIDLMSRQQAQNQWRKKYQTQGQQPMATPTLKSNKSMIAPWEGSVWNSERWKREQQVTNEILKKQVKEKDEFKRQHLNSGQTVARQINSRNNMFMSFDQQAKSKKAEKQKEYSAYLNQQIQLKRHHSSEAMGDAERKQLLNRVRYVQFQKLEAMPKIPGLSVNPSFPQPRGKIEQRLYMIPTNQSMNKGAQSISPVNRAYCTLQAGARNGKSDQEEEEEELQKQIKIYDSNKDYIRPKLTQIDTVLQGGDKAIGSGERPSIHQQTAHQVLGYNTIINPIPGYQQNPYFNGSNRNTPHVVNDKSRKGLF